MYVIELKMAERVRKYRTIRKRVQSHVNELFRENNKEMNVAVEHIHNVSCITNISDHISSVQTDDENADDNYYLYENNMDNLGTFIDFDNTITSCSEEFNTDLDNTSTSYSDDNLRHSNSNIALQNELQK